MARSNSTGQGCAVLIALVLVAGGCMQLKQWLFPPEPVRVPNLIGQSLTEARSRAEQLGLRTSSDGMLEGYCPDSDKCVVMRMTPSPGATVPPESTVTFRYLTKEQRDFYRKYRRMPRVIGWSEERVRSLFDPVWRTLTTEHVESKAVRPGADRVIRQSPKPGARLRVGQKVKIVIGYNLDYDSTGSGGSGRAGGSHRVHVHGRGGVDLPNFNPCRKTRWC